MCAELSNFIKVICQPSGWGLRMGRPSRLVDHGPVVGAANVVLTHFKMH